MPAERRFSVMKKRTVKYGRKIVRLHVGDSREVFTMHEDLLCANSPYFRQRLQKKRQPIEGECSICHEAIELGVKELNFCTACGANMHYECMENWKETKKTARQRITCPLCRVVWVEKDTEGICQCPDMDEKGLEIYSEWIYKEQISVGEAPAPVEDDQSDADHPEWEDLMQAYILGEQIEDHAFRKATLESFIETLKDVQTFPPPDLIDIAYNNTSANCGMRKLLVETFVTAGRSSWFDGDEWEEYPAEFLKDLAQAFLSNREPNVNWDVDQMKKKCLVKDETDDEGDLEEESDHEENEEQALPENGGSS